MSKPRVIASFRARQAAEGAYDAVDRGLQCVKLQRVVGSVSRYLDFDRRFRLKARRPGDRLQAVRRAMRGGAPLAPVDLCKIKDEYYVADGHHRVAVAKELGFAECNARVVEFLPSPVSLENVLYRERQAFESETGLAGAEIRLTEAGKYAHLLQQITRHWAHLRAAGSVEAAQLTLAEAAADWLATIYGPLTSLIEASGLPRLFPGRTLADLYAYISWQQWDRGAERRYGRGIEGIIGQDMEEFQQTMRNKEPSKYPEMLREITAFVLANIATKRETGIVDRLFELDEVREVHSVHGSIDLLVKVLLRRDLLSSDAEVISQFVQERIRRIPGIISTQTLIPGHSRVKPVS